VTLFALTLAALAPTGAQAQALYDAFIRAVTIDDAGQVRAMLARGVDPNTVDPNGEPVLVVAARAGWEPTLDALLAAIAVSLLVNDTPVDVIGLGALAALALFRWESLDSRPMRRGVLTAAFAVLAMLAVAGCGAEGVVSPKPLTVIGTVKAEAPGKAIFNNQGCGACHTYAPAGPDAQGKIGPDLDKLADYAKRAKQPLATFVHDSIVNPDKYVEKGYPKGVMPKSYKSLPPADLKDLVDFLTKPQG